MAVRLMRGPNPNRNQYEDTSLLDDEDDFQEEGQ